MRGYLLSSQGDRMLMANSVEGRFSGFPDHRVIEFANRLLPAENEGAFFNEKYSAEGKPGDPCCRKSSTGTSSLIARRIFRHFFHKTPSMSRLC
ncbi:MAG: asparagine synthase-related protein [Gammaproteobacteria bacterium]